MENKQAQKKSLWVVYNQVQFLISVNQARDARDLIQSLSGRLHEYTAPSDLWFNFAMDCARLKTLDVEMEALERGLEEWSDNIDLLCAKLQCLYSTHENWEEATQVVQALESLPLEQKASYWRYWTYVAIYYGVKQGQRDKSVALLDEGLRYVKRDNLAEYLRTYRRVYIDSAPSVDQTNTTDDPVQQISEEYRHSISLVADRLELGLRLGLENGYSLAIQLAVLYQEQAYATRQENGQSTSLQKALEVLEFAEQMFTPTDRDTNFPLHTIYKQKVNVLMGLKRYDEARELLLAMKESSTELSNVQQLQLQRAAIGAGKTLGVHMDDVVGRIKEDSGQALTVRAKEDSQLANILQTVGAFLGGNAANTPRADSPVREMDDNEILGRAFNLLANNRDLFVKIAREHEQIADLIRYVYARLGN